MVGGLCEKKVVEAVCVCVVLVTRERESVCVCFTLVTIFDEIQREREWERCHA